MNPPSLTDESIRAALLQMAQAITTQAESATAQDQDMMTQAKCEVVPLSYQQFSTMDSRIIDFTRTNHPTFYESKVDP